MELTGKTVKGVVFDLDGTLLDTLEDLRDALNYALTKVAENPITLEEARRYVGNGVAKLVARALPNGEKNPRFSEALALMRARYASRLVRKTKPYAGIVDALSQLHEKGLKIAVVSNKPEKAVKRLTKKFFPKLVDVALGDVPTRARKPAPDGALAALEKLNLTPQDALYVGDSDVDLDTAKNAKLPALAVTWGFRERALLESLHPAAIADSPTELTKIILKHRAPLRIGVFGGSFDPVHKAHLLVAKSAQKQLSLDLCLFVPAYDAPHLKRKNYGEPGTTRAKLLSAAIAGNPNFRLELCELKRAGVSFTVDTLKELQKRLRPVKLFFILGSDNRVTFSTWRHPEEIKKLARLVIYEREGHPVNLQREEIVLQGKPINLSSTALRKNFSEGKIPRAKIPSAALTLIRRLGLYGLGPLTKG